MALREINVDTLVSTLTRRGRDQRDRPGTLKRGKRGYFFENPEQSLARTWDACMTGEAKFLSTLILLILPPIFLY